VRARSLGLRYNVDMTDQDPAVKEEWVQNPVVEGNDLPSAEELRDRASISQDLQLVVRCIQRLLQLDPDDHTSSDAVLTQALWTTALIAYARCFGSGVRIRLTNDDIRKLGLNGEPEEFHRHLLDLRSKHVAHSVNAFESLAVGIVLSAGEPLEAEGTAVLSMRHVAFTAEGLQSFEALATRLLQENNQKCQSLQNATISEAKSLRSEDLRSRRELSLVAPEAEQASRRRP
jgi:hypothetical protein